jgi:hypothetical protein
VDFGCMERGPCAILVRFYLLECSNRSICQLPAQSILGLEYALPISLPMLGDLFDLKNKRQRTARGPGVRCDPRSSGAIVRFHFDVIMAIGRVEKRIKEQQAQGLVIFLLVLRHTEPREVLS